MPNINVNSIETNAKVYVDGIVDFSRITSLIEGDELTADNARKMQNGLKPTDKPHTRMTISHAAVSYANPSAPTLAEQYIADRLYSSPKHPEKGLCYTAMNKTKNLPEIYARDGITSKRLERVNASAEVASDVSVTLVLRFFATTLNKGVSLDAIIINEKPIRWATSGYNGISSSLAERGFEIVDSDENATSVDDVRSQLAAAPQNVAAPAQPAPVYAQPVVAPAPVAPASAPAPVAPVTVPAGAYAAPVQTPVTAAAPAAPARPTPPKGYTYDAEGRLVPETQAAPAGGIKL